MAELTCEHAETSVAIAAVTNALDIARQGTGEVHFKSGRDVVTDTDIAIEDRLRATLLKDTGWPVIGEERGGQAPTAGAHRLVDPICGTRNFASGIPLFCVNVALVRDGLVVASVVGDGSTGEVLVAERGHGAWCIASGSTRRVATSDASQTIDFEAWPNTGPQRDRAARIVAHVLQHNLWDVRILSSTLSLAYIAGGRLAACVLFSAPGQVHIAAGTLLVTEAGGTVTDVDDHPWTLEASSLVCSATRSLHDELMECLHRETA